MSNETKKPESKETENTDVPSVVEQISEDVLDELAGGMLPSGHSEASWSRST